MAPGHPDLRNADYSSIDYKIEEGKLFIKAGEMPTPGQKTQSSLVTLETRRCV